MNKYRALVSFAGSILSMYAGEVKEISDDVADEFLRIGYIVPASDLDIDDNENEKDEIDGEKDNEEEEKEETQEDNKEEDKEESKTKTTTKRRGK